MKYITAAETAKIVRAELKKAYHATKFSVRSSTYSMGAHVGVTWTDGPTTKQVDALVGRYGGSTFDSCQDLRTSVPYLLNGEMVQSLASSISCQRTCSLALYQKAAKKVSMKYGVPAPEIKQGKYEAQVVEDWSQIIGNDTVARVVIQTAYQMAA